MTSLNLIRAGQLDRGHIVYIFLVDGPAPSQLLRGWFFSGWLVSDRAWFLGGSCPTYAPAADFTGMIVYGSDDLDVYEGAHLCYMVILPARTRGRVQ